ncbi:Gfo/Idh/MocA family protein [Negadavirga shengliensis]|uniref:Gfo/Idh/MocA family protein n=1 Tax=Negadavirga shengliensis TaxID=1389218 RepID=A0ABV9SXG8_9BACT
MNKEGLINKRRQFIKTIGLGTGALLANRGLAFSSGSGRTVRLGFVGVGARGISMLKIALSLEGVEVAAICDILEDRVSRAQDFVEAAGQPRPQGYSRGPEDYKRLVEQSNLDAVYTATPWHLHAPVMLAAMKAGKYGGTEMPACSGIDEAWELVETSEKTGMPCMLMENYCYMQNVQMILNMAHQDVFGDLSHCEVGYQHDTRYVSINAKGELLWRAEDKLAHNGNRYPTHAIGPAAQWLDINRGDRFEYLVSMSSRQVGMNHYAKRISGPDHPNARLDFQLGDVNTTLIKTNKGITVTLYYDCQTPRPVDFIWRIQGTKGIYSGTLNKIHLEDRSRPHQWEETSAYVQEYDHPNWKKEGELAKSHGHGGSDYFCMLDFVQAVRNRTEVPIDVYDAATWSVITALTESSVNHKSQAVDFPDFTRGKWKSRIPHPIKTI